MLRIPCPGALLAGLGAATVAAILVSPAPLQAVDPPHWGGLSTSFDCTNSCHKLHSSLGGSLTTQAGNANLCQSCHFSDGSAAALPTGDPDRADLASQTGTHHAWNVRHTSAAAGATAPTNPAMLTRLNTSAVTCPTGDCITCSTCHNQHAATSATGGTARISPATKKTALGSTGTVTSGGTFTGANGSWYLIEIASSAAQGTARFGFSRDNGNTWFPTDCNPPLGTTTNCLITSGTAVLLADGVTATFGAGDFTLHERWDFYASWPFLRAALDSGDNATGSKFCRDCHSSWTMDYTGTRTYTNTYRSHPVGVALNANSEGYDRAIPLDGNGAAQGSGGDANATNDYKLDSGGRVQCLSCHAPHYADSNTMSVDVP